MTIIGRKAIDPFDTADDAPRFSANCPRGHGLSRGVSLILLTMSFGHAQQPAAPGQEAVKVRREALRLEVIAQERAELESLKRGDLTAFSEFLSDDAIFVDAQGAAGKGGVVKNVADFRLKEFSMTEVRFIALSENSGLITYRVEESGTSHGREFAAKVLASAVWVRRGGTWMCVFSQETAAK